MGVKVVPQRRWARRNICRSKAISTDVNRQIDTEIDSNWVRKINAQISNSLLPMIFTFSFRLEILHLSEKEKTISFDRGNFFRRFPSHSYINSWRSSRFRACNQSHFSVPQFYWLRTEEKKRRPGNRFAARDRRRYFRGERSDDRKYVCSSQATSLLALA